MEVPIYNEGEHPVRVIVDKDTAAEKKVRGLQPLACGCSSLP
jgi:hypothetical protein